MTSPWLPTAPCVPEHCATAAIPATAGRLRAATRLATGVLAVLAGVVLSPLTVPLGPAARRTLTRLWCRTVLRAFGVRVQVTGTPPRPGPPPGSRLRSSRGVSHLVVANHISWLDIPLVAAVLPGRMVAKTEIRHWLLLGPLAARGGTLFLDRDRLRALPGLVHEIAHALAAGSRVVVFPEGSTWCGRAQGRFRPAAFQAALDAGAPVQPVRITYRPLGPAAFVGDDPLTASLWRIATAGRGLTAEIRLMEPIPADRHPDRRALARAAQHAVRALPPQPPLSAPPPHTAVASDSPNHPFSSVHQRVSSRPAADSSALTPS